MSDQNLALYLELLGTRACHLCDAAEQVLVQHLDLSYWQVEVVDIAEDDALMEAYSLRIPVLKHGMTQRCLDWPFGQQQLHVFMERIKEESALLKKP